MFSVWGEFVHSTSVSLWLHGELHKLLDDTAGREPWVAAACPCPASQITKTISWPKSAGSPSGGLCYELALEVGYVETEE